jgi:DNA-binding CsgD family transcriptional regulator
VPCEQGALVERLGVASNSGFGLTVGTDPAFLREYAQEFRRCDPFAREDASRHLLRHGRAMAAHEVLLGRELGQTEFYKRFLRRYGDLLHGLGGAFGTADGSHAQVWLLRGGRFDEDERRCLDVFIAHARAALRLRRTLARIERERDTALALMDACCDAIWVVDENGRLLIVNALAEHTLRDGRLFSLRGRQLRAARALEPDWVEPLLRNVLDSSAHAGRPVPRCVALPGQLGMPHHYALFAPLTQPPAATRVAVILRDLHQDPPRFDATQLRLLFALTQTEARVANLLLTGRSSEDIALDWDVRSDTARAHVKRMLAKTGTRNQGDLQKLLLRLVPNLQSLCRDADALEQ